MDAVSNSGPPVEHWGGKPGAWQELGFDPLPLTLGGWGFGLFTLALVPNL